MDPTHKTRIPPPTEVFGYANDGTPLTWQVYLAPGSGLHTACIVTHGGGFWQQELAPQLMAQTALDLQAAGYNVFVSQYRLAPTGKIPGQVSEGWFTDQWNDMQVAIVAARNDHR
jgi:acetyl esterase/lipase